MSDFNVLQGAGGALRSYADYIVTVINSLLEEADSSVEGASFDEDLAGYVYVSGLYRNGRRMREDEVSEELAVTVADINSALANDMLLSTLLREVVMQ